MNELSPERFIRLKYNDCNEYYISNHHRIFSVMSDKIIKPYLHKSRNSYYWRFSLNGFKKMGHIIVADHFLDAPTEDNMQVDHIDGNTLNNFENNLRWVTQSFNIKSMHARKKIPIGLQMLADQLRHEWGLKNV